MSDPQAFLNVLAPELKELVSKFLHSLGERPEVVDVETKNSGVELRMGATANKPAGRPRILLFSDGPKKVFAFFYKPSRLAFSKDRFSYGLMSLHRGDSEEVLGHLREGLQFLLSDFKPSERPKKLGRLINVDIPRD